MRRGISIGTHVRRGEIKNEAFMRIGRIERMLRIAPHGARARRC
jgi:hypothetical protein